MDSHVCYGKIGLTKLPKIHQAALRHDVDEVKKLSESTDLNSTYDVKGKLVLHRATEYGNTSIIKILLNAGANPNATTNCAKKSPPLYVAIRHAKLLALDLLLQRGADLTQKIKSHTVLYEIPLQHSVSIFERTLPYVRNFHLCGTDGRTIFSALLHAAFVYRDFTKLMYVIDWVGVSPDFLKDTIKQEGNITLFRSLINNYAFYIIKRGLGANIKLKTHFEEMITFLLERGLTLSKKNFANLPKEFPYSAIRISCEETKEKFEKRIKLVIAYIESAYHGYRITAKQAKKLLNFMPEETPFLERKRELFQYSLEASCGYQLSDYPEAEGLRIVNQRVRSQYRHALFSILPDAEFLRKNNSATKTLLDISDMNDVMYQPFLVHNLPSELREMIWEYCVAIKNTPPSRDQCHTTHGCILRRGLNNSHTDIL